MNTMEPTMSDNSNAGLASVFLAFVGMMYLMYEHFDRRYIDLRDKLDENNHRFNITEEKLALLEDIEQDVQELKDAEAERSSSWEDDVSEPNKYQAILGQGKVGEDTVEIRFIIEKINTFKSNRYWLLNDVSTNLKMIHKLLNDEILNFDFTEKEGKYVSHISRIMSLNGILHIVCFIGSNPADKKNILTDILNAALTRFVWKRGLLQTI